MGANAPVAPGADREVVKPVNWRARDSDRYSPLTPRLLATRPVRIVARAVLAERVPVRGGDPVAGAG
jgi:hypothetical protein